MITHVRQLFTLVTAAALTAGCLAYEPDTAEEALPLSSGPVVLTLEEGEDIVVETAIDDGRLGMYLAGSPVAETDLIAVCRATASAKPARLVMLDPDRGEEVSGTWSDEDGRSGRFADLDGGAALALHEGAMIKFTAFAAGLEFDPVITVTTGTCTGGSAIVVDPDFSVLLGGGN